MNNVQILIISSTIDYSTDLVCYELEKKNVNYLRLNRDKFSEYQIVYNLENSELSISIANNNYLINENNLKCIYFRAPIYLRAGKYMTIDEQLSKGQWNAFIRNLIVFSNAKWINHPVATYRAENKLFQLKVAKQIGFYVPKTDICNTLPKNFDENNEYIVKSLDTALFYCGKEELFTYSNIVNGRELINSKVNTAPIILQELLRNKVDLRITVIGDKVFSAKIISKDKGIDGDWRMLEKDVLRYSSVNIPLDIEKKIIEFMNILKLEFAGIDLALVDNNYYFIECNPTGEWGWLVRTAKLPIDVEIANLLCRE